MNNVRRKARIGLTVVKALVADVPYLLMRANPQWKDISFIGGHEKARDGGDLQKTARRELWEEVPSIRSYTDFLLEPLTPELHYGPVHSRSRGDQADYEVQFFLLRIDSSPTIFVRSLGSRTRNIWIPEYDLLGSAKYRLSGYVELLDQNLSGGLRAIPYSFVSDLRPLTRHFEAARDSSQLQFALKQ